MASNFGEFQKFSKSQKKPYVKGNNEETSSFKRKDGKKRNKTKRGGKREMA